MSFCNGIHSQRRWLSISCQNWIPNLIDDNLYSVEM